MNIEKILDDALAETPSMLRGRPYDGQPWTDGGERGKQEVSGVTMRDIRDCFVRAFINSHLHNSRNAPYQAEADKGEAAYLSCNDMYDLEDTDIDPMCIAQNLTCEIEKIMGIFPNVPKSVRDNVWENIPIYNPDGSRHDTPE